MSNRILLYLILSLSVAAPTAAQSCAGVNCLVISQVYGGGGNSGATLKNDFIEIFNRGSAAVSLSGVSVQYASATGSSWQVTPLSSVNLQAGQFYLVQEAQGAGGTTNLPTPDDTGTIAMSATAGKVALVNSQTAISGACPLTVLDIMGYGNTSATLSCIPSAPALTNPTSDSRTNLCTGGTLPTSGFTTGTPAPRNASSTLASCGTPSGISFTPSSLPAGTVGTAYSQTFTATGGNGTYSFSFTGTLPPGLKLSTAGVLSGTPTTAAGSPFSFSVTATDGTLSGTQAYSVIVNPNGPPTCTVTNTIAQIQGSGTASPLVASSVTTSGIVTALRSNGFYFQMPAPGDSDSSTSDGIFVFTSSAPGTAAALGNSVCVSGTVSEFTPDVGFSTITELISPTVTQLSMGNPLPSPVLSTAADFSPTGGVFQREKYEGMRVAVSSLTIVAPTQGTVNEANATATSTGIFFGVIPGTPRPFREQGIDAYDVLPLGAPSTIPRWDDNPEILRVNTTSLVGGSPLDVTTGATVSNLVGVVDYKFGQYTLLNDPASPPSASGNVTFTAIPAPLTTDLTIGSFNVQRFFDTVDDPGVIDVVLTATALSNRLAKASLAIRNVVRAPDVLALEEMENLSTAQALAAHIDSDATAAGQPAPGYSAYLVPGNDIGGINNAFLVKASKVNVISVTQYGKNATYTDPTTGNQAILYDRPPLVLHATAQAPGSNRTFAFTVIANHLRSLIGVNDNTPVGSSTTGNRVRAKREAGAEFLANLTQTFQSAGEKVFVVGDLNAYQVNDGYVDVIGVIRGNPAPPSEDVVPGASGLVSPILTDAVDLLSADQTYSDTFDGTAQVLDHVLFTANVASVIRQVAYGRVNADFPEAYRSDPARPERVSDHDPVIAYVTLPPYVPPTDVTAQTSTVGSGLSYNRVSQIYSGTLTVTNRSAQAITGPVQILFTNISAGATLQNPSGTSAGAPYLTLPGGTLAAGASATVTVQFKNTGTARIGYTTTIYSGGF